jgi:hypothetical protein
MILRMSSRGECRGLLNARDSYSVSTVMAAFLELPTDEVEFVRGSIFIRVICDRIGVTVIASRYNFDVHT